MTRKFMQPQGVSLAAKRRNGRDSVVHYSGAGQRAVLCNVTWTADRVAPDGRPGPICLHCKREWERLSTCGPN
jgi:hypothetical protein